MPVRVAKIGKKWRVVGPDGKPETNKKGTSVDSGGHNSKESAMAQVRAINFSLHKRGKI